jgi:NAD(P)-dependent dehydrogenase (short-subunit alcohol dehydrogenase family)
LIGLANGSNRRSKYSGRCFWLIIGGLGKEFLTAFAISGARSLAMIDRDLPVAVEACSEIRATVRRELGVHDDEIAEVNAWGCDVTNTDEVRKTIDEIGVKFGGTIDIFVAAAGTDVVDFANGRYL